MNRQRSSEELAGEHLRVLGPELGALYNSLYLEVTRVHAKWSQYKKLYGHSSQRIALLNRTAGYFFKVVQDMLWDDVQLHLARLVDSPKSAGAANLTIRRLPDAIDDAGVKAQVQGAVDSAVVACRFARTRRHRRIAHTDLSLALGIEGVEPLPAISRRDIDDALKAIATVMNVIERHYFDATVGFDLVLTLQDAESLVFYLQKGAQVDE